MQSIEPADIRRAPAKFGKKFILFMEKMVFDDITIRQIIVSLSEPDFATSRGIMFSKLVWLNISSEL